MTQPPELSCYTSSLVAYLEPERPAVRDELAAALGPAVRTDLPDGALALAHHPRLDVDADGRGLVHRGAAEWERVRDALGAELDARGRVLVVGNTRHVPWSPAHGRADASHWFLVDGRDGDGWRVDDRFVALTPHGEQRAFRGRLDDAALRRALTPPRVTPPEVRNRDRYALGTAVELPPEGHHRWLEWSQGPVAAEGDGGRWVRGLLPTLRHLARVLCDVPGAPARYADDVWTVVRHQRFRLAAEVAAGAPVDAVAAHAALWEELPRAVRFAAASAARGRPRTALLEKTFALVVGAVEEREKRSTADA